MKLQVPGVAGDGPRFAMSGSKEQLTVQGVAVFYGLVVYRAGSGYRLLFTAPGLLSAYSELFTVAVGPPVSLTVIRQPSGAWGGYVLHGQPSVQLQDQGGNAVNITTTVRVRLLVGNSTLDGSPARQAFLNGTLSEIMSSGFSSFTNLAVDLVGQNYRLNFSALSFWTLSKNFSVSPGGPSRLIVLRQPQGCRGGELCDVQPQLLVVDAGGNAASASELYVTVYANETLNESGDEQQIAAQFFPLKNGLLQFNNLSISLVGEYTMMFESPGIEGISSSTFFVIFGKPQDLVILKQPGNGTAGYPLEQPLVVYFVDAGNNSVLEQGLQVLLSLNYSILRFSVDRKSELCKIWKHPGDSNVSAATAFLYENISEICKQTMCETRIPELKGGAENSTQNNGFAYFHDITIDQPGEHYFLDISSPFTYSLLESATFSIQVGGPSVLSIVCSPHEEFSGQAFYVQPVIQISDAGNNLVPVTFGLSGIVVNVILMDTSDSSALLVGTRTSEFREGSDLAAFTDLQVDGAGTGYVLQFSGSGQPCSNSTYPHSLCSEVNATNLTIVAGRPVGLAVYAPTVVKAGEYFSVDVTLRDSGGSIADDNEVRYFNATLYRIVEETFILQCRGKQSCTVILNTSRHNGVAEIFSLNLTINLICTDFSFIRDYISELLIWATPLARNMFNGGPWEGCYGSCSVTRLMLDSFKLVERVCWDGNGNACMSIPNIGAAVYDPQASSRWDYYESTPMVNLSSVPVSLTATPTVNFYSCDGYFVNAEMQFSMVYLEEQGSVDLGIFQMKNGQSSLSDLKLESLNSKYSVLCNMVGFGKAFSAPISVSYGPIRRIAVLKQPGNGTGDKPLIPQPWISVQDNAGNIVKDGAGFVVANVSVANLSLSNEFKETAANFDIDRKFVSGMWASVSNGTARFSELFVGTSSADFPYFLTFVYSTNLSDASPPEAPITYSARFYVVAGVPTGLKLIQQPLGGPGGYIFEKQPIVGVVDLSENLCSVDDDSITVSIGQNGGVIGRLSGTQVLQISSGIASFTDLSIDLAGRGYTLLFYSDLYGSVETESFDVTTGPAFRLAMQRQPADSRILQLLSTQPSVQVLDKGGNLVRGWSGIVTVFIQSVGRSPYPSITFPTAHLLGDLNGTTQEGIIYFWNLRVDAPGVGFVLGFTANPTTGIMSTTSSPFSVVGDVAAQIGILLQPTFAKSSLIMSDFVLAALDENGVIDVHYSSPVTAFISSDWQLPANLAGSLEVNFIEGLAVFSNLVLSVNQSVISVPEIFLNFSSEGLVMQQSNGIIVLNAWIGWWKIFAAPTAGVEGLLDGYFFLKADVGLGQLVGRYLSNNSTLTKLSVANKFDGFFQSVDSPYTCRDGSCEIAVLTGNFINVKYLGLTLLMSQSGLTTGYISFPSILTVDGVR